MYKLVLVSSLCVFWGSCTPITRMTESSSDVSSINISKPNSLPENYSKSGGYSLCIERGNPNDSACSNSILKEGTWSKSSTVDYELKNNCNQGYKLKMWLWADESNKKNENSVYVLSNAGKGNELKNGYAIIPKSKLTGGTLTFNLSFRKVNGDVLIVGDPDEVNIEVVPTLVDENGKVLDSSSKTTSSNGFNFDCDTSGPASEDKKPNPGTDSKSSDGAPTGSIVALHSPPSKIPSDYPVLIVYVGNGCDPCTQEKKFLQGIMPKLKGKMHVYTVDGGHSYSTPTNIFYKNGQQSGSPVVGYDDNVGKTINSRIQSLIQ